ncbi:MAG: putative DNA binding domain-containing protein [Clostridiales bacterium]|nr:putative DNA binding domain-containing protein [Clostridiales bacterium]
MNTQYFDYDKAGPDAALYLLLSSLIDRWETEVVEFKEAKGQYDADKIGRYFSAISNEANLRNKQYGWLIFGVSEATKDKRVVGTNFKDTKSLSKFKYEIAKSTTGEMSFIDIYELYPHVGGKQSRVVMFKIPAAVTGIPTAWKNRYYSRNGDSLDILPQYKIDMIRGQVRWDWSAQVIPGSDITNLDKDAIAVARSKYKDKKKEHIQREVDGMTDEQFLRKLRLINEGQLTYAAMVLLGKEDCKHLIDRPPTIMWRLYGATGKDRAYELFEIPFINVGDRLFEKIRNLQYKYMPNRNTLLPEFTSSYNQDMLYELLHNCVAHMEYRRGARIYLDEYDDKLIFTNPGDFIPGDVRNVLNPGYAPPFYKNQLLAETMASFGMIDTASMGIRRVYEILRDKYFPMPDYDIMHDQVRVTVYGSIIDEKYTHLLYDIPDLDLETVFLMDRVQKKLKITGEESRLLRKMKLIEGKMPNLYLSAGVAESLDEKEQYIKNRAFNDEYYKKLIVDYLKQWGKGQKQDFKRLLWEKLPDGLTDKQKDDKIANLLSSLRRAGVIRLDGPNQRRAYWIIA